MNVTLRIWRQESAGDQRRVRRVPPRGHLPGHVLRGDASMSSTRSSRWRAAIRSPSTATAGRGSAVLRRHGERRGPRPLRGATCCQVHMRCFRDGDVITIEPWRARRSRSSRTLSSTGGPWTGSSPPAGSSPPHRQRPRGELDPRLEADRRAGDGHRRVHRVRACVASCPNASAIGSSSRRR